MPEISLMNKIVMEMFYNIHKHIVKNIWFSVVITFIKEKSQLHNRDRQMRVG